MLPAVGHVVVVGIRVQWTGEVIGAPSIRYLVLLDVVQTILVGVAVGIGGVGRVEEAVACGVQGIAVLETVWHAVTISVPVTRSIESSVAVHVLFEPSPVAVAAHVLGVWCLQSQCAEHRHSAVHTKLNLSEGNLVAIGNQVAVAVLL